MYYLTDLEKFTGCPANTRHYFRIIGHCKNSDLDSKKEEMRKWLGVVSSWTRGADGRITDFPYASHLDTLNPRKIRAVDLNIVFGFQYNSTFQAR